MKPYQIKASEGQYVIYSTGGHILALWCTDHSYSCNKLVITQCICNNLYKASECQYLIQVYTGTDKLKGSSTLIIRAVDYRNVSTLSPS